jgi:hypothetical protein
MVLMDEFTKHIHPFDRPSPLPARVEASTGVCNCRLLCVQAVL